MTTQAKRKTAHTDDLAAPRDALLEARDAATQLLASLEREHAGIVDAAARGNSDDEHDPEGATIAFERERTAAQLAAARDRIDELNGALARINDGSYGVCISCGAPIGSARLAARPAATNCISCAATSTRR